MAERYIAAVDQGTASSRCLVFDRARAHRRPSPRRSTARSSRAPGWVEHDADGDLEQRPGGRRRARSPAAGLRVGDLVALGHHQPARDDRAVGPRRPASRCTTRSTGRTRAPTSSCRELAGDAGQDRFRERCGLPLATYFSAPKIRWLLDNVPALRERAEAGEVLFGTMDSWLIWKLTGRHLTDVTNASRTMLMNLADARVGRRAARRDGRAARDAARDPPLDRRSTARRAGGWPGCPVAAALGDQQAALFGQTCFDRGEAKCTYGTGSFLLMNTGERAVHSRPTGC